MKRVNFWHNRLVSLAGAVLSLLLLAQSPPALAWFQPGGATDPNFEIDTPSANILDGTNPGDDWETIYRCTHAVGGTDGFDAGICTALGGLNANFLASTGIVHDHPPSSVYTGGGSKDINDIPQWKWKNGAVPDKNDIEHGYAAAYTASDGDGMQLIVYIGADRFDNNGDASMGAWFFQDEVVALADGTFSGHHRNGDIFWTGDFTGGGVITSLSVYSWQDPSTGGTCAPANRVKGSNLCLISTGPGGGTTGYVASVNNQNETALWDFTPKTGIPNNFPFNSFMEGGLNLTKLLGGVTPCFSSFLIESRSSAEPNAQLKDFVLGQLNTCRISVAKSCTSSVLAADKESLDHSYEVSVTNTGGGTITKVDLYDDVGTPDVTSDDRTHTFNGNISAGQTVLVDSYTVNNKLNPPTNTVTATGFVGQFSTAPVTTQATCQAVTLNPNISANKTCMTLMVVDDHGTTSTTDDRVAVRVDFAGQVCNDDTQSKLTNITATDDKGGALTLGSTTLQPSTCTAFSGSYFPGTVASDGTPSLQSYTDTVSVSGKEPLTQQTVSSFATANCSLCPICAP